MYSHDPAACDQSQAGTMAALPALVAVAGSLTESERQNSARFFSNAGRHTVLSASGSLLIPQSLLSGSVERHGTVCTDDLLANVLAPASLLWPFLDSATRQSLTAALTQHSNKAMSVQPTNKHDTAYNITVQLPIQSPLHGRQTLSSGGCTQDVDVHQLSRHQTKAAQSTAGMLSFPCRVQNFVTVPSAAVALDNLLSDVRNAAGGLSDWHFSWSLGNVPSSATSTHTNKSVQHRISSVFSAVKGDSRFSDPPHNISACLAVLQSTDQMSTQLIMHAISKQKPQLYTPITNTRTNTGIPVPAVSIANRQHHQGSAIGQQPTAKQQQLQHHTLLPSLPMPACMPHPGRSVLICGSPFGCLAPQHFANTCMQGVVSMIPLSGISVDSAAVATGNSLTSDSDTLPSASALFTVDAPCLPGMEGGLVIASQSHYQGMIPCSCNTPCVLGMLCLPLSRSSDGVQIQVAISWHHIIAALRTITAEQAKKARVGPAGSIPCNQGLAAISNNTEADASQLPSQLVTTTLALASASAIKPATGLASTSASISKPMSGPPGFMEGMRAVVLVRTQHSWGTGVVVTPGGLVLTNAHLLLPGGPGQEGRAAVREEVNRWHTMHRADGEDMRRPMHGMASLGNGFGKQPCSAAKPYFSGKQLTRRATSATCMVRVAAPGSQARWCAAHIMYIFTNHLDLAVLQMTLPGDTAYDGRTNHAQLPDCLRDVDHMDDNQASSSTHDNMPTSPAVSQRQNAMHEQHVSLQPSGAANDIPDVTASRHDCTMCGKGPVYVVGHGLVGPAAGWPAAVTAGNIAQVVHALDTPCMMITTATVHAGASGGAVLDTTGRLIGLVTSNARHASGHTLPNLNFCIPAAALQPIIAALLRHEQRKGSAVSQAVHGPSDWTSSLHVFFDAHASRQQLREELERLDQKDAAADRIWNLEAPPPAPPWLAHGSGGSKNVDGGGSSAGYARTQPATHALPHPRSRL